MTGLRGDTPGVVVAAGLLRCNTGASSTGMPSPSTGFVGWGFCHVWEAQRVLAFVPEDLDELVSTTDAANACSVSVSTVRAWVARGHLVASGLDERRRPLYRLIDVLRAERATRLRQARGWARYPAAG